MTPLTAALYEAVAQNHCAEVRRLLAADVTWEPGPKQEPLLHLAADRGYEEIVTLLLEHGYDPNAATEYQTAVKIAALNGDAAMIRLLLARGADPDLKQPLYYALYRDHAEAALALIAGGADLNALHPAGSGACQGAWLGAVHRAADRPEAGRRSGRGERARRGEHLLVHPARAGRNGIGP